MKISELIKHLKYELNNNGDCEVIFSFKLDNDNTFQFTTHDSKMYFNSDTENLYIQNYLY